MKTGPSDCLCAGIIVADHVCRPVDHLPAPGELVLTDGLHLTTGGCASNVAVHLATLGRSAPVVGRVGDDLFGRYVCEALAEAGVRCEHIIRSPTAQTSGTFVINCKGEDRRFIHAVGANAEFTGNEITAELLENTKVLYLGGYCLMESLSAANAAKLFEKARQFGVHTVLDVAIPGPGDYRPRLRPVLPFTDVFCPNDDEGRMITSHDSPLAQAEEFHAAGAKTVFVTCGGEGAVVVSGTARLRSGSYPVEFVDGTGSGDAFTAGVIHGLLSGREIADCLRYGTALGGACVQSAGATTGALTGEELEGFVGSRELEINEV